ncbi:MAG: PTS sugar transporter subunit IIC [Firmicutes bacterium]|nr:PTS sugar transporter subunit IIC [Bacillota bacterium]
MKRNSTSRPPQGGKEKSARSEIPETPELNVRETTKASGSVLSYAANVLNAMALGLFASLIVGVILEQIGNLLHLDFVVRFGQFAKLLMGPVIGVAVAGGIKAPPLALYAAAVAGALGAGTISLAPGAAAIIKVGEPVGALVAALAAAEVGKRIAGKTKLDIILVPVATILVGGLVGERIGPWVSLLMRTLGAIINEATMLHPIPMGIIVSTLMGMILTLPISSAAIAISLGLSGLAGGAATVGCSAQMIGFAVISYRENGAGGLLAQGLGTSMLQVPNIIRNPRIWIPPTLAGAILGPLATRVFFMENIPTGAGMGTSGLVGQIGTIAVMGTGAWAKILLLHFILPALLAYLIAIPLRRIGWIQEGDMKLDL